MKAKTQAKTQTRYVPTQPRKAPPVKPLQITWAGLKAVMRMALGSASELDRSVAKGLLRAGLIADLAGSCQITYLGLDLAGGKVPVRIIGNIPSSWSRQQAQDNLDAWRKSGVMIISHSGARQ